MLLLNVAFPMADEAALAAVEACPCESHAMRVRDIVTDSFPDDDGETARRVYRALQRCDDSDDRDSGLAHILMVAARESQSRPMSEERFVAALAALLR